MKLIFWIVYIFCIIIIFLYRVNCFFDIGMMRINFDDDDDDDYIYIVFNIIYWVFYEV